MEASGTRNYKDPRTLGATMKESLLIGGDHRRDPELGFVRRQGTRNSASGRTHYAESNVGEQS